MHAVSSSKTFFIIRLLFEIEADIRLHQHKKSKYSKYRYPGLFDVYWKHFLNRIIINELAEFISALI